MHVSVLKKYIPPTIVGREAPPKPKSEILEGVEEYEVEKILGERVRYGKKEYLIKWVGYDNCDNTWTKIKNLVNTSEYIEEWEKSQQEKKKIKDNHVNNKKKKKSTKLNSLRRGRRQKKGRVVLGKTGH